MVKKYSGLFRTKPNAPVDARLRQCLSAWDLTFLGIGAIIGAGIFVLTGIVAATHTGPAIVLSYLIAGAACAFSALCYAELAAAIGGCGSAYGYAYAGFGELIAWIIGWDLLLEYAVTVPTVAIGWAAYMNDALLAMGHPLPDYLIKNPFEGGWFNLPAAGIVILISIILAMGVKQSARVNTIMVLSKLFVIGVFIAVAIPHLQVSHWHPFMPFGWSGVMGGAALIFFAYIGFDAVSTAAEEAKNPQKDLPRGIIISLVVCTFIYIIVSAILTGITPYNHLNVSAPIAHVLLNLGHKIAAGTIAVGAIAGLFTVILVMYYGFTRIVLAMSRDGLLPRVFAHIHPQHRTPQRIIFIGGCFMALFAAIIPMKELAQLVNIGTLSAFALVNAGVILLRRRHPDWPRPFKTPLVPYVPILGMIFCLYLIYSLSYVTWLRFLLWMILGLLVYFYYSYQHSQLSNKAS